MTIEKTALLEEFFQYVERRITKVTTKMLEIQFNLFCKFVGLSKKDSDTLSQSLFGGKNVHYEDETAETKISNLCSIKEFEITKNQIEMAVGEKNQIDRLRREILNSLESEEINKAVADEIKKIGPESIDNILTMNKLVNLIDEADRIGVSAEIIMAALSEVAIDPEVVFNSRLSVLINTNATIN